jgi:hypothetical protein
MKRFKFWKRIKWFQKIVSSKISTIDYILFVLALTMIISKFWNSYRQEAFVPQHSNIGDYPGPEGYN